MSGFDLVHAAMTHQEDAGDGDGYFLKLTLKNATQITGAVYPPVNYQPLRMAVPDANGSSQQVWVDMPEICVVEIVL